ncbi:MAG: hypothetical protein D6788_03940 [Planctomycetota bacterium]|nr:MAG: hypothetical protein D6788_03940 [Planctomycetota bacterium]
MNTTRMRNRHRLGTWLAIGSLLASSGCATLAHRSSVSGRYVRHTANCTGEGDKCPWLASDALLLFAGIVPGVVAFAVDFSSGAWKHDNLPDEDERPAALTGQKLSE